MATGSRIVATIEARMTSSRLPGKVMMTAGGEPFLKLLIERLKAVRELDAIMLATTINAADDALAQLARELGIDVFRGSEHDVLGRVRGALDAARADICVEITADCPFTDPAMVSACIAEFERARGASAYVANTTGPEPGVPYGFDIQVFEADALREFEAETDDPDDREHVSMPFYRPENANRYHPRFIEFFPASVAYEAIATLDYPEDYALLRAAHEELVRADRLFGAQSVVDWCRRNPELTRPCLALRGL